MAERREAEQGTGPSPESVPWVIRLTVTEFGWRHVRGVAVTRSLVAIWLVLLGSLFCVSGHWWGALLFVPAALVGWLAYQIPRWKLVLDGRNDVRLPLWTSRSSG